MGKWSRNEIHSLKLEARKRLSENEVSENKARTTITEMRKKLVTADAELRGAATEQQTIKTIDANAFKHSSDQYQDLRKTMGSTKQDYIEQCDRHTKEEEAQSNYWNNLKRSPRTRNNCNKQLK